MGTNYVTIPFKGALRDSLSFIDEAFIQMVADSEKPLVVLNFSYAEEMQLSEGELASFRALLQGCMAKGQIIAFVKAPEYLQNFFQTKLNFNDCFYSSLAQALKSNPEQVIETAGPELDLLSRAVVEVFDKQFSMKVVPETPLFISAVAKDPNQKDSIIGLIALNAKGACGSLLIRFPKNAILQLAEQTYGQKMSIQKPEVLDVASELVNMILGCAKEELNARGYGIEQALPQTLVSLPESGVSVATPRPYWKINVQSPVGELSLEVCLKQQKVD